MRAQPGDAGGYGESGPSASADGQERVEANDSHGGVRATTNQRLAAWIRPIVGRFGPDRPPRWFSSPLVLVAVLAGLVAFSSVWGLMGEAAVAVSVATIVGVCAGSGTVVAGTIVWTRLADRPAAPGY